MKKQRQDIIDMRQEMHKVGIPITHSEVIAKLLNNVAEMQTEKLATKEQVNSVKELLMAEIRAIHRFNTFVVIYFSAFLSLIVYLILHVIK